MSITINRPLGENQRSVLHALRRHGSYFKGCGWIWTNPSGTEKILDSLVKRGLVEVGPGQHHRKVWKLTEAGQTETAPK